MILTSLYSDSLYDAHLKVLNKQPGRHFPLRHHLLLLIVGVLLPVVAFSAAVVWRLASGNRAIAERRLMRSANEMAVSLDRELASTIRSLNSLAQSQRLEHNDIDGFREEAVRVLRIQPSWWAVILIDPDGQIRMHTAKEDGTLLPRVVEGESFKQILDTGEPVIGVLKEGPGNELAFPVRVPVILGEKTRYVLTAAIRPSEIMQILNLPQTTLEDEWNRGFVDARGTIVARAREPEKYIGRTATPFFRQKISAATEGVFANTTLDGKEVYVAFRRAPLSGWTASVSVPTEVLDGPARRSFIVLAGAGLGAVLISAFGAVVISRWVSHGIVAAGSAAEQLARGGSVAPIHSTITEIRHLYDALVIMSGLLLDREHERTENLARAEAARKEAEAANGAKDRFLAVLSHELRTPLTPIVSAAQFLERNPNIDEDDRALLAMILRNVRLEVALIDDLLDLTRVARGKLQLNLQTIDLHEKIRQVVEICSPEAQAKHQRVKTELLAARTTVQADPARIQQVLWNLLKNAVKFTQPHGAITVRTRVLEQLNQIVVEVIDNGVGIPADALGRIFDAFEQGDSKITRQFGGLGLGLAISRAIVSLHGGALSAQSDGPNTGSTFTLTLPLTQAAQPTTAAGASTHPSTPAARRAHVLLVEDSPDSARVMSLVIRAMGYEVDVVGSVVDALQQASSGTFDVVISDIGLPDGTGYDLMLQLRDQYGLKGIAVSGYGMEDDITRSLASGFTEHLTKPIDRTQLESALNRALADINENVQ